MSWNNFCFDNQTAVSFYPEMTEQILRLDEMFLSFVAEETVFNLKIPSLIPRSTLEKCGYFSTFPQHLTKVTPFQSADNIEEDGLYLSPAACIHFYPMLEKNPKKDVCYTTLQRVYRYENGNYSQDERLWEFTVREFVFVGSPTYVLSRLDSMKEKSLALAKTFSAKAELQQACDAFYPSARNIIMQRIQVASNVKTELSMPYEGRSVAVGSFNYHQNHFSKPFHFDANGTIVTGCVGFGIERWALCALSNQM